MQKKELPGLDASSAELLRCESRGSERGKRTEVRCLERRACFGRQEGMLAGEYGNWDWLGKSLGQVGTSKRALEMNMGV